MKKKVTLNNKEQKRLIVLNEVLEGRMMGQQAAEVLGVTLRHTRRILGRYRREGAEWLAHDNRGEHRSTSWDEPVETDIVRLA